MEKSDVFGLTQPFQLLGLAVVLSAMAFSGVSTLVASLETPEKNTVPNSQVELWRIN
ncbi:MAG: hypothetical protein HC810_02925 [Acaryochloridaceae cyanobacterium RL_2_7]|nr:hypothetical protein [Acaryochloridaceae cyanobacterium RL_2_7]